ncbi:MAG: class I SAM-dependent methyltransferase [Cyanobacteria bacterium P01_C01_bin.38]
MEAEINQNNQTSAKLSSQTTRLLRCPICNSELDIGNEVYKCTNNECRAKFPWKRGIPILINESFSLFNLSDFIEERDTYFELSPKNKFSQLLQTLIPDISLNVKAKQNYQLLKTKLLSQVKSPKVLVIGGSISGEGIEAILKNSKIEFIETDVSFGPRTQLICDAHCLPFADKSLDGVIIQAVLEHVVDPFQCVREIYRVLKDDGIVYSETPFMQQVHGGCYDFTRFTYLGHRRLFRKFYEIDSGAVCGPGMALAWSYKYLLLSFTQSMLMRKIIDSFVRLTAFPFRFLDYLLIDKIGTLDAASAYYFMGKKSNTVLSDRELLNLYKGNF